jgi:hypothetical protein
MITCQLHITVDLSCTAPDRAMTAAAVPVPYMSSRGEQPVYGLLEVMDVADLAVLVVVIALAASDPTRCQIPYH